MKKYLLGTVAMLAIGVAMPASGEEAHVAPVTEYVNANVKAWLADPAVVSAIKAQNEANTALDQAAIEALDQKWRSEVEADSHPMIDAVLGNALSTFLKSKQSDSGGTITEIFVTDAKGLNVGQSDVTSDYWQGDEDKFQKSFGIGPAAFHISDVELDESTQTYQAQLSFTLTDPATGAAIGAVTVGVNAESF
jgi:hypothetical protein